MIDQFIQRSSNLSSTSMSYAKGSAAPKKKSGGMFSSLFSSKSNSSAQFDTYAASKSRSMKKDANVFKSRRGEPMHAEKSIMMVMEK